MLPALGARRTFVYSTVPAALPVCAKELEGLACLRSLGDGRALVVSLPSASHSERDLDAAVLEIEVEREERVPLPVDATLQVADLLGVEEELPHSSLRVRKGAGREE